MSVVTNKYNPLLFSERVAPNANGALTLCRAASLAMGYDAATNGDWTTNANGSRWGRAKIKRALEKMRAETGEPLRDGYNQSHQAAFLRAIGAPEDAWEAYNRSWSDIAQSLRSGWTVELAGNVVHTPADSPLRKYVNPVDHDILLLGINDKTKRVRFIDPMTPHGTRKYIRSAPSAHFRQFGSEFRADGTYIAGRMRRGRYSDAAGAGSPALIERLKKKVADLSKAVSLAKGVMDGQDQQISVLEQEIVSLQNQLQTSNVDIPAAIAAVANIELASEQLRELLQ